MPQPPPVHALVEHAPPPPPPPLPPTNADADIASPVRSLPHSRHAGASARWLIRRMASNRVPHSSHLYS